MIINPMKKVTESAKKITESAIKATSSSISTKPVDAAFGLTHDLFLASIGGISLAQEEIEKLVKKLIERGQIKEEDGKKYISDLLNKTKKTGKELEIKVEASIQKKVPTLEIPNKKIFSELEKKIDAISEQVDKIVADKTKKKTTRRTTSTKKTTTRKRTTAKTTATAPKAAETKTTTDKKPVAVSEKVVKDTETTNEKTDE